MLSRYTAYFARYSQSAKVVLSIFNMGLNKR
jgi:hypothetical protein